MFIDTHCHIHDRETFEFARSRQQISKKAIVRTPTIPHDAADFKPSKILNRASRSGVTKMITVGTSVSDSQTACDFAEKHENVFWTYGIHPDNAREKEVFITSSDSAESGKAFTPWDVRAKRGSSAETPVADRPLGCGRPEGSTGVSDACRGSNKNSLSPVAIGEIGLDYHSGTENREAQIRLLEQMLDLAKNEDLPCIFHVRNAFDDFWPIVDNAGIEDAVIHSFSDSEENLKKALNHGFYIGVNGLATFADLPTPPLDRTLLETDAPFLAPDQARGRVNEPAYLPLVAAFLSEKHHVPLIGVALKTTKNAETLFNLS